MAFQPIVAARAEGDGDLKDRARRIGGSRAHPDLRKSHFLFRKDIQLGPFMVRFR